MVMDKYTPMPNNNTKSHQKAVTMHRRHLTLIFFAIIITMFQPILTSAQTSDTATCEAVRVLMANNMTPYDMDLGGGGMGDNIPVFGEMPANHYADFWSFTVTDTPISTILAFDDASEGMEFAIFRGMERIFDYTPLVNTRFTFENADTYTVIVRRINILDDAPLQYTFTLTTDARGQISPPEDTILTDTANSSDLPSILDGGRLTATLPMATVQTHADAIRAMNSRGGATTQIYFPNIGKTNPQTYPFNIDNWAQRLRFLGGDMALQGTERTYFLQNFGYEVNLDGLTDNLRNLANITYADGAQININWDLVQGAWIFDDCVGFKFNDGRTFIGEIGGNRRFVQFNGTEDNFTISLNSPIRTSNNENITTSLIRHNARFNLAEIRPNGEMRLTNGVFYFPLVNDRELTLESTDLQVTFAEQTNINLSDSNITLTLDWENMGALSLQDEMLRARFTDKQRISANFERSAVNLRDFEALNDTLHLRYSHDTNVGLPGEERLILSTEYGYIELITPQGFPEFDGRAMPDEANYVPRALNNTGAECYPTNTILPELNCAPNGEVNPANGNLFYAIEDMTAFGGLQFDFARSYNSRLAHVDGPLGWGWSTAYRLDYNVSFDPTTATRPITPEHNYRVGLDVTWAPRGLVTFITPSGSQHQFVSNTSTFESGTLTAITMPGWTLSREDVSSDEWILNQIDGLTYVFDRAGRLLRYTNGTETITIDYPHDSITGANANTQDVVIRDDGGRTLSLTYNDDGHITQATLSSADGANQQTTDYRYTDGYLTGITYADGTTASYSYDNNGRLIEHNDPRAPISPHMRYAYDANGNVETVLLVNDNGEEIPHRFYLIIVDTNNGQRRTAVIDEMNNRREYTYRYTRGELRAPADTFTLATLSNPLTEVDAYENHPTFYRYNDVGLMVRTDSGQMANGEGRGAVSYEYNPFGQITCIACVSTALPSLRVDYQILESGITSNPTAIRYANGTSETFGYDENGHIITHTDTNGAAYSYEWDDNGRIIATVRTQDGERTTYTYNDAGQVNQVSRTLANHTHTITYTYDWLGRVTVIDDSELGRYTIDYAHDNGTLIRVTDPIGVQSVYQYDLRNRLVEMRIEADVLLALTTYSYDVYNRLTGETNWLIDDTRGVPITTTYEHERRPTLESLIAGQPSMVINGTQITQTQPGQGMIRYTFDGLDRIRRVETPFNSTDYNYSIRNNAGYQFGLSIQQQILTNGRNNPQIIDYIFDSRRQLRDVRTERQRWEIQLDGNNVVLPTGIRPTFDQRLSGLQSVNWGAYVHGIPTNTQILQGDLPLLSGFSVLNRHTPENSLSLDFLNRPTSITNAENDIISIAYCPTENGTTRHIYTQAGVATCETTDFDMMMTYDANNRLIEAVDPMGTRTITYTPQPENHTWQVDIVFTGTDGDSFTWRMIYDGIGHLLYWRDADGFERHYTYDTLGRLTAVTIDDQPENSFTFRYNDANKIIEETDGLGRGFLYDYNELGQVISRLYTSTADITSYAYTQNGLLETVITSDGNITTYRYDDPLNPERLTAIVEPTGSIHTFTWDDLNNTFIYTDPRNQSTHYRYDGNGLLWRIDDPLILQGVGNRTSELQYNSAGELTAWVFDERLGNIETEFTFDHAVNGEIAIRENVTGWSTSLAYAESGQLLSLNGNTFTYDILGRLTGIRSADENNWTFKREDGSPIIFVTEGYTEAVELRYDALFRLVSETRNDAITTTDYEDETVTITYPDNSEQRYIFSSGDSTNGTPPTVTWLGDGMRTRYLYNINGLLTEIRKETCVNVDDDDINTCPAYVQSVTFTYDGADRPLRVVDANGNFEAFTYNVAGNIATYEAKNGRRFNYNYDEAGRLDSLTSSTGIRMFLAYNMQNKVIGLCRAQRSVTDYDSCAETGIVIETYAYDALGRMIQRIYHPNTNTEQTINYSYLSDTATASVRLSSPDMSYTMTYNALGQLTAIDSDTLNLAYLYDEDGRIIQTNENTYVYDAQGRLIQADDLIYDLTDTQQTITDTRTGQGITYTLNPQGIPTSINDDVLTIDYPARNQISLQRHDDLSILQNLNANGDVVSVDYQQQLSIVHQPDANGYIRRQVMSIPGQNVGYAITIGYDNDDRPLTMRVTDILGLRVLYTQTFNYDANGLLIRESRQYRNNTQVTIDYIYTHAQQLTQQLIRINQTRQSNAGVLLLLGLLLIPITVTKSRRWIVTKRTLLLITVFGGFTLTAIPTLYAQQTSNLFTLDYVYNDSGSVESVIQTLPEASSSPRIECLRFDYDDLNRLTRVRKTDLTGTESQITYRYDAFNRLTHAGDFTLTYDENRLFAIGTNNNTYYFGGIENQPPQFAIDQNNTITWLYNDGRDRIVAAVPDGDTLNDVWLFDPFNRYLALAGPSAPIDGCALSNQPDNIPDFLTVQPYGNEIWDVRSNLYIQSGRAYNPEETRHLQRALQAPDALGYVYNDVDDAHRPPVIPYQDPYHIGLAIFADAQTAIALNDTLTAQAVMQQFEVRTRGDVDTMVSAFTQSRDGYEQSIAQLVNLPLWLQMQYNLPAPQRSAQHGGLTLPDTTFPAQGNIAPTQTMPIDTLPNWQTDTLGAHLSSMPTPLQPPQPFRAYLPWTLSITPYDTIHHTPDLLNRQAPGDILAWLPQTLNAPAEGMAALDFVAEIHDLARVTANERVTHLRNASLPTAVQLPPENPDVWLNNWFSHDTFGLNQQIPANPQR